MKIIKLLFLTILICIIVLVVNIVLGVTWEIDQVFMAILSGFFMMIWLIYFAFEVFRYYLSPNALFGKKFAEWGFKKRLYPTREEYFGNYKGTNTKVDITKGRWQTNAYIYMDFAYSFLLAIGKQQPLQVIKKLERNNYLSDHWDKFVVLNDNSDSINYLNQVSIRDAILYLINKYDVVLYWEPDRLKIHVPFLKDEDSLIDIIENATKLK